MAIIESDAYESDLTLPYNLPLEGYRLQGADFSGALSTLGSREEQKVLMGRTSDLTKGDPNYEKRLEEFRREEYLGGCGTNF
jgi:hypothetical protein